LSTLPRHAVSARVRASHARVEGRIVRDIRAPPATGSGGAVCSQRRALLSDEILRNIIAERVLGLPPEMRTDKGIAFKDVPTGPKNE
jgi:hypothetical protein